MDLAPDDLLFDEELHTYSVGGKVYPSVTGIIRAAGFGPDFSSVPSARMEWCQRRGKMVHLACQMIDEHDLDMDTVSPAIRGYVEAYLKFRAECVIKVVQTEISMASRALKFAGTPDLICFIRGRRSVVDRKTSVVIRPYVGLQTAGYKTLWDSLHPKRPIACRYGLRLGENGNYTLVPHTDPDDFAAFRQAHLYMVARMEKAVWEKKYTGR